MVIKTKMTMMMTRMMMMTRTMMMIMKKMMMKILILPYQISKQKIYKLVFSLLTSSLKVVYLKRYLVTDSDNAPMEFKSKITIVNGMSISVFNALSIMEKQNLLLPLTVYLITVTIQNSKLQYLTTLITVPSSQQEEKE